MLSNAISIDPRNPLARFQKAQVLLSTEEHELALTELKQARVRGSTAPPAASRPPSLAWSAADCRGLARSPEQLVEMAPKEGSVYFVLGKVYKKLGDQSQAMLHLTRALDLSPKDAQQIKAAILNLEKEDNAEEEEEL